MSTSPPKSNADRSLPRLVSVRKSVQKQARFEGVLPLSSMDVLMSAVEGCQSASASVSFSRSESGAIQLQVMASAEVDMTCQRCLRISRHSLSSDSLLSVVRHDEEARQRLADIEPLVLDEDELDLHDLVIQELSLVLPIVPMHSGEALASCERHAASSLAEVSDTVLHSASDESVEGVEPASDTDMRKPFAGLGQLIADSASKDQPAGDK